jgi:hypothetical protein
VSDVPIPTCVLRPGDPSKSKYDFSYVFKIVEITEKLQIALKHSRNSAEND